MNVFLMCCVCVCVGYYVYTTIYILVKDMTTCQYADVSFLFSSPPPSSQGPMGPRGPPGPTGSPVSTCYTLLSGWVPAQLQVPVDRKLDLLLYDRQYIVGYLSITFCIDFVFGPIILLLWGFSITMTTPDIGPVNKDYFSHCRKGGS